VSALDDLTTDGCGWEPESWLRSASRRPVSSSRPDADRAALIGRLHAREDARLLAELDIDLEDEPGELVRLKLVDGLRRSLGREEGG
jgi:hypothetical protein